MENITEKQQAYIESLLEKKISMWDTQNAGMVELTRRRLYSEIRTTVKATHPNDKAARRAMSAELKTALTSSLDARINDYINAQSDHYNNVEMPQTKSAASALIDELKNSW